jgi:charged multivesicular body protein 7
LKAYETSTSTLKSLLSLPELQLSSVESTVSNLQDALADQADIDEAVRLSPSSLGEEQELEDELEGMVTREKEAKERERETKLLEARVPEREQTAEKPQEERVRMAESTKEGEKEKERVALPA